MAVISTYYQENRTRKPMLRIIFRPCRAQHENGLPTQGFYVEAALSHPGLGCDALTGLNLENALSLLCDTLQR